MGGMERLLPSWLFVVSARGAAVLLCSSAAALALSYALYRRQFASSLKTWYCGKLKQHERYVPIPRRLVGQLIGKHGRNLRQMEFETRTTMKVLMDGEMSKMGSAFFKETADADDFWEDEDVKKLAQDPYDFRCKFRLLRIRGAEVENIELALLAVKCFLKSARRPTVTCTVSNIPAKAIGFIFGSGHGFVQRCRHACHVDVQVSQTGADMESVHLTGAYEEIQAVKVAISRRLETFYVTVAGQPEISETEKADNGANDAKAIGVLFGEEGDPMEFPKMDSEALEGDTGTYWS